MGHTAKKLQSLIRGIVYDAASALEKYATDKSIYRIPPLAVVIPQHMDDLHNLVKFSAEEGIPITARGGGSGTAGSALGAGIVVAFEDKTFLQGITNFHCNDAGCWVTVEAGVRHQALQDFLKQRGYYLPADPSSGPICRIGGNIATKASGPHGLSHGAIDRFLEHIAYISAAGEHVDTLRPESIPEYIRTGVDNVRLQLKSDHRSLALLEKRKGMKTSSGYNLFPLLDNLPLPTTLARLFAGSVGTLGLVTRAVLRVEPYVAEKSGLVLFFTTLTDLGTAVETALGTGPTAIEMISRDTVTVLKNRLGREQVPFDDAHLLFVEFEGGEAEERSITLLQMLRKGKLGFAAPPQQAVGEEEVNRIMSIRKQILPVLMRPGKELKALSIVNDVGVFPENLPEFIKELEALFDQLGLEAIIYGHAGNGNLHLRPLIDVSSPGLNERIQTIADKVYELVFKYNGTITAEHGMGRLRAPYLEKEWGRGIFSAMKRVKSTFDPDNLLNPDAMFGDNPITDNLRDELRNTRLQ